MTRTSSAFLLACSALAACSQPSDPTPPGMIGRTIVTLNPDGEPTVKTSFITPAQQREEVAARAQLATATQNGIGAHQQALSQDTSCAGSSLWIFDNYNNTIGSSFPDDHEICFFRNGVSGCADLKNYRRYCIGSYCVVWGSDGTNPGGMHSFWAGNDAGFFQAEGWDAGPNGWNPYTFSAWTRVDDTDSLQQAAYAGALCFN